MTIIDSCIHVFLTIDVTNAGNMDLFGFKVHLLIGFGFLHSLIDMVNTKFKANNLMTIKFCFL